MQVKISLLYNQFLARTNVALTSRMPCNSPYIFNYPLEYLAHWLFFGKFLSRASNTMPPRVRSPRPFCPCLAITYLVRRLDERADEPAKQSGLRFLLGLVRLALVLGGGRPGRLRGLRRLARRLRRWRSGRGRLLLRWLR